MGTHPIFESDFDCLTDLKMPCEKECAEKTDVTIEDMKEAIKANFSPLDHFEVDDLGTCGTSYKVIIVSSMFEGMKTLDKHKLVNEKLKRSRFCMHSARKLLHRHSGRRKNL